MRAAVADDEEAFRFMYRLKQRKPVESKWLMVYTGDWHLLLHSAKALLKRYWGAGIEHVANELSGDDKNAAEGRNYRRAHHHLTVMYEAFLNRGDRRVLSQTPWTCTASRRHEAPDTGLDEGSSGGASNVHALGPVSSRRLSRIPCAQDHPPYGELQASLDRYPSHSPRALRLWEGPVSMACQRPPRRCGKDDRRRL